MLQIHYMSAAQLLHKRCTYLAPHFYHSVGKERFRVPGRPLMVLKLEPPILDTHGWCENEHKNILTVF